MIKFADMRFTFLISISLWYAASLWNLPTSYKLQYLNLLKVVQSHKNDGHDWWYDIANLLDWELNIMSLMKVTVPSLFLHMYVQYELNEASNLVLSSSEMAWNPFFIILEKSAEKISIMSVWYSWHALSERSYCRKFSTLLTCITLLDQPFVSSSSLHISSIITHDRGIFMCLISSSFLLFATRRSQRTSHSWLPPRLPSL